MSKEVTVESLMYLGLVGESPIILKTKEKSLFKGRFHCDVKNHIAEIT